MAFTYSTKSASAGTVASNNNPITVSYTCAANTNLLVLGIVTADIVARTGGAPAYNNSYFTKIGGTISGAAECTTELWYLSKPVTGVAQNIIISNTNTQVTRAYAVSFTTDTGSQTTIDVTQSTIVTMANPSLILTGVSANAAIVDVLGSGRLAAITGNSTGVLVSSTDEGAWNVAMQHSVTSVGGTINLSYTQVSDDVAYIAASFKEYTAGAVVYGSRGFMTTQHYW
jgi:hypothetical protein